jgi:hypothetical protein
MSVVRSTAPGSSTSIRSTARAPQRRSATLSAGTALLGIAALASSCTAVRAAPLSDAAIASALELRVTDAATLEQALEFARLAPLPFALPEAAALRDPAHPLHLRARVLVHAPAMRAARRAWLSAAALDRTGAQTAPLELGAEFVNPPGADSEIQAELTFDLLGLFGAGRAGASRALATAEQRRALAELWSVAWSSLHDAERARVLALAARERVAALRELARVANDDRTRIEILARDGYARPDQVRWAWSVLGEIGERDLHESIALAEAEARFATAVGLPVGAAREWLSRHGASSAIEPAGAEPALTVPPPLALLANHPRLLAARLEHAVAEARVQLAASELIPELRVGPKPHFLPGEIIGGGVVGLEMAWPPAVRASVRALEHAREAARERLEDELLALQNELVAKAETLRLERDESLPRAAQVDVGAEAMWTTARVRFANATDLLEEWSFALEHRVDALLENITVREHVAVAALDWNERLGSPEIGSSEFGTSSRKEQP